MLSFNFDAYVVAALFDAAGKAVFALGDGRVVFEDGASVDAHPDAGVLCAVLHPSGDGVITGGDDGRLVWSRPSGAEALAEVKGRWIDAAAASAASSLIAFCAGKEVRVISAGDAKFARAFPQETTALGVAFDPKGLRLAVAGYGGPTVWYARIAGQKPVALKWAGIHTGVMFSPDGRFVVTTLQDAQLHAWRLSDSKDMRMAGYPAKVKSMAFMAGGDILATSGAQGAVLWPFTGPSGPMGRQAAEVAYDDKALVERVVGVAGVLAGGRDDGRLFALKPGGGRLHALRQDKGPPITALALTGDGQRLAWGDEDGAAGVIQMPVLD
ncbi:MAG TPA: WD40 repeat domain-containing protein [Caulobacteraceae bacterium]|nr:WD40 repeat domain-containing protein [Caulobacteraceae bacterium]